MALPFSHYTAIQRVGFLKARNAATVSSILQKEFSCIESKNVNGMVFLIP